MAKLPPVTDIEQLLRDGWDYSDIAERYGAQREAVLRKLRRAGKIIPRTHYTAYLDWKVDQKHSTANIWRLLRDLYKLDAGESVPSDRAERARGLADRLDRMGMVVAYDPKLDVTPVTDVGGFYMDERKPGDGKYHRPWGADEEQADARP